MKRMLWGFLVLTSAALGIFAMAGGVRGMLWLTVQACVLDHRLTGSALPCLSVQSKDGAGYVILRGPLDRSHVILSPTTRMTGIESPALRMRTAVDPIAEAWRSRAFADPDRSGRNDTAIALAINSRWGRSQDQFHIHIDCLRPDIRRTIARDGPHLIKGQWSQINFETAERPYWATTLGNTLSDTDPIAAALSGLKLTEPDADRLTIAITAVTDSDKVQNFVLLAQAAHPRPDDGHAEELLDHDCGSRPGNS